MFTVTKEWKYPGRITCTSIMKASARTCMAITGSSPSPSRARKSTTTAWSSISSKIKEIVNRFDHALINDVMGDINPTAENMAKWLCDRIPHCVRVSVQETEGNVATYEK